MPLSLNKAKIILITVIVLWASAFVGIRFALHAYSPGAMALLRYATASLVMLILYCQLPNRRKPTLKELIGMLALGVSGFGIYNIALNYGEISVSAGISGFIISQSPIIIALIAVTLLREKIRYWAYLGMFISFIGVILIAIGESE